MSWTIKLWELPKQPIIFWAAAASGIATIALAVQPAAIRESTGAMGQGLASPQTVLQLHAIADVVVSPDGKWVAYRVDLPREGGGSREAASGTLWLVPAAGGEPSRIKEAGHDARQPRWSPDGSKLSWIAQPDLEASAQIYVRAASGGEPSQVTNSAGAVLQFQWSPDSSRIAFTAWDAKTPERLRAEQEGKDWRVSGAEPLQSRLYVVSSSGGAARLLSQAQLSVHDFDWSPDGRRFLLAAAPSPSEDDRQLNTQVYLLDVAGGEPRLIVAHRGRLTFVRWSADGKFVAWLSSISVEDPWAGSLFTMPADGSGTPRNLMPGYDGTATWLGPAPGRPRALTLLLEEHLRTAIRVIDLDTGRMELVAAPVEGIFAGSPSYSRDGRTYAAAVSAPSHPAEAFVGRTERRGAPRRLTKSNPSLAGMVLGRQEVTRWKSKDGLEMEGLLIEPVGYVPGRRYPIVLHIHGGSESVVLNGWQAGALNLGQSLAARGYAVLYPNYRGSRGRGTDFVRGNRHDLMGREWEDIESALDHAIALGIADRQRAGIYGFSWGGYAAGWGATYASHRFEAAVAGAGIYDWISEAGSNATRLHEQLAHWGSPLYEDFLAYLDRSPIYHVRKARTPTLLLHGELDESCPLTQAVEMHTALKWEGVPVELVIFPREGHGMREPAHQREFLGRALGWFDRYLKR